jgi:hypothetical protein
MDFAEFLAPFDTGTIRSQYYGRQPQRVRSSGKGRASCQDGASTLLSAAAPRSRKTTATPPTSGRMAARP